MLTKMLIRVTLVLASLCMVCGNIHSSKFAMAASLLFFVANLASFNYNLFIDMRKAREKTKS